MDCPKCKVELKPGIAIDAGSREMARSIVFVQRIIKAEDVKLISCLKCPKCGYSDDGVIVEPKLLGFENRLTNL